MTLKLNFYYKHLVRDKSDFDHVLRLLCQWTLDSPRHLGAVWQSLGKDESYWFVMMRLPFHRHCVCV